MKPGAVPVTVTPTSPRITVPIASKPAQSLPTSARLPMWVHALVILLIVAGVAIATMVTTWALTVVPASGVALWAARQWAPAGRQS